MSNSFGVKTARTGDVQGELAMRRTPLENGLMDPKPARQPRIVGSTDGTYAILRSDGAAASFVDGKWQPGLAFESRDFMDMSMISNVEMRTKILNEAAEALAKSLEQ